MTNPQSDATHWMRRKPELIRRGTQANGAKVTADHLVEIAEMDDQGCLPSEIAAHIGVSRVTIWRQLKAMGRR